MKLRELITHARFTVDHLVDSIRNATRSECRSGQSIDVAPLEERIMLSASPIADPSIAPGSAGDAGNSSIEHHNDKPQHIGSAHSQEPAATTESNSLHRQQMSIRQLVFVDDGVDGYRELIDDLTSHFELPNFEVVVVDSDRNGIAQITESILKFDNIDAIHLVSHGREGEIHLGNTVLTNDNIDAWSGVIAGWGSKLSAQADLLIYGCNLAGNDDGKLLLESIGELTAADVAASDDLTGHEALGGDWELEYVVGEVDTGVAFSIDVQANWYGTLETVTVTNATDVANGTTTSIAALQSNDGGDGISLREAIIAANNTANAGAPDEIHFEITDPLVGGFHTISVAAGGLPGITEAVVIDATTDSDFGMTPIVALDGSGAGSVDGLSLLVGSDGSTIRGLVVHSFGNDGIQVNSSNNIIVGNYIGTDGVSDLGNAWDGVTLSSTASNNRIGGTSTADRNILSGNNNDGIWITGGTDNIVQGNWIGLDASGGALANSFHGIGIDSAATGNLIGGTVGGAGNRIENNAWDGIAITDVATTGNSIIANTIADNGGLGIDINNDNVTNNDYSGTPPSPQHDTDSGPNDLQNYPDISTAEINGTDLSFYLELKSAPNTQYRVEVFGIPNGSGEPIGNGEAHSYLGAVTMTTDANGEYSDFANLNGVTIADGDLITATATVIDNPAQVGVDDRLAYGNTSEFAANISVVDVTPDITTDLVAHHEFEDGSGTTADDSTVNNNDGALVGDQLWTSGQNGGGFEFDYTTGSDDYFELTNSPSLENVQEGDYTLAAWFKPNSTPPGTGSDNDAGYAVIQKTDGRHTGIRYANDNKFIVEHWLDDGSQVFVATTNTYAAGQFYHVASTVDVTSGQLKIYVNGVLDGTANFTPGQGAWEYNASTWKLGIADPGAGSYRWAADGVIDDSRIYARALSATDVAALYFATANNAPTNLSSGIELNTDGGNDSYLIANDGSAVMGGLDSLSIEIQFATSNTTSFTPLFSYASPSNDNEFAFVFAGADAYLYIADNDILLTGMDYSALRDGTLQHLAVTWDNTNGDWAVYSNGELIEQGTGHQTGNTIEAGGELVFGNEQDSLGGSFQTNQAFRGTLHDIRIWDEVRSEAEIALNWQQKIDPSNIPNGLVANWQMDGFNGSNEVVDIVSEGSTNNRLSIGHASGAGFVASTPVEDLNVDENSANGTTVGYVVPTDPDLHNDILSDGQFQKLTPRPTVPTTYTVGQTIGDWTVTAGSVDVEPSLPGLSGQLAIDLSGSGAGTIASNTLATEVGRTYQVTFSLNGNFSGGDLVSKDLRVSAGGETHDFTIVSDGISWINQQWENRSFTFVANSTSTTLSLKSLENNIFGAYVTDISVIEIPAAVQTLLQNDTTLTYDAAAGKFYKTVAAGNSWGGAGSTATATALNGVNGQLATIRNAYEQQLIRSLLANAGASKGWLGGYDFVTEGEWHWMEGTAEAEQFADAAGNPVNGSYENFNGAMPDGGVSQNFLEIDVATGEWNDALGSELNAYVIEWDASEVLSGFTFSLTDDAGGRFAIDASTGEITVADGSQLDYESATSHDVTFEVTDAAGASYSEAMTIAVNDVADGPVNSVPGAQNVDEDNTLTFSTANGNAISVDDGTGSTTTQLQVRLTTVNGTITLSQTTGLSFPGGSNGSSHMVIWGTEADINAALEGATFTPDPDYNGPATIDVETEIAAELHGHYEFENAGDIGQDTSVGVLHSGTANGDAAIVNDATRGNVLSLDGAGDHVLVNGEFSQPPSITLAAWVNGNSTYRDVFSIDNRLILRFDDVNQANHVNAIYHDGTTYRHTTSTQSLSGTGWHHVALTFDDASKTMTLYIDGAQAAQNTFTGSISYLGGNTAIGGNAAGGSLFFNGLIDDARIYTRALTADEITALANDAASDLDTINITVDPVNDDPIARDDASGLDFDGVDDYISIADSASLTMTNTVTMEAWFRAESLDPLRSKIILNKEGEYEIGLLPSGELAWAFENSDPGWAWHLTGHTVTLGEWTHVAVTYDNGTANTYVNGNLIDTYNGSGSLTDAHPTLDEFRIGGRMNNPADQYFDGQIDEVRIWNIARSEADIQSTLDTSLTGGEAGLAGYWRLDETTGTNADDSTANFNDGTVIGTATPAWQGHRVDANTTLNVAAAGGVLANDVDVDGDALTVTEVNGNAANVGNPFTLPSGALLTLNSDGSFDYDPNGAYDYVQLGVSLTDTFDYTVTDGNVTDTATVTIRVAGVNEAPVLNSGPVLTLADVTQNDTDPPGDTVAAIIASQGGDRITDVDIGAVEGIAVTGRDNTNGTWQYSIDGGSNWLSFGTVSSSNATVLADTALVRFVPNAGYTGNSGSLSFRAWDQTDGSASGQTGVNIAPGIGGTGAYSLGLTVAQAEVVADQTPVVDLNGGAAGINTSVTFTEDNPAVILAPSATVDDVGEGDIIDLSLVINGTSADGSAEIISFGAASVPYGTVKSGTVTFGSTTFWYDYDGDAALDFGNNAGPLPFPAADLELLIRSISYENTSDAPTIASRSVTFRVSDVGGNQSTIATADITLVPVNDAAVVDLNGANGSGNDFAVSFTEGDLPVTVVDTDATISDVDHSDYLGLGINAIGFVDDSTERIFIGGEAFQFGVSRVVTATVGSTTFELDFDGSGFSIGRDGGGTVPQADIQALLGTLAYEHTSQDPTAGDRTLTVDVNDAAGLKSNVANATITVNPVNDDPVVTLDAGDLTYVENDTLVISPGATVSDIDSADFDGGTLTVDYASGNTAADFLAVQNVGTGTGQIGVSGSDVTYNWGGGSLIIGTIGGVGSNGASGNDLVITLNSNADATAVEALVRNIMYSNISHNPTEVARPIEFTLTDGDGGTSVTVSRTVTPEQVNDSPSIGYFDNQNTDEDTTLVFSLAGGNRITINDPDIGADPAEVTLTVTNGTLTLAQTTGLSGLTGNGTSTVTFTGNLANINAALNGLAYAPTGDYAGSDVLVVQVDDQGDIYDQGTGGARVASANINITVDPVNDAPVLSSGTVQNLTVNEDSGFTPLGLSGLSHSPGGGADEAGQNITYQVTVIPTPAFGSIYLADETTVVSPGTYTLIEIQGMKFRPADDAAGGPSFFEFQVIDDGGTANGGADRISHAIQLNINPVNDAPSFIDLDDNPTYTQGGSAVVLDVDVSIADVDLDALNGGSGDYSGSALSIIRNGGINSNDQFGFNDGNGITLVAGQLIKNGQMIGALGTAPAGSITITFSSPGSEIPTSADVVNILRQITYSNDLEAAPAVLTFDWTFNDGGNQGLGGQALAIGQTTVRVDPVPNGAPINTVPNAQSVDEDTLLAFIGANQISVSDTDGNLSTVRLQVNNGMLNITLSGTASISAGANDSDDLTLSGSESDINNTLASLTYQGDLHFNGSDTLTITSTDTNSETDVDVVTITVDPVNDAPTFSNLDANPTFVEDSAAVVFDTDVTVADAELDALNGGLGDYTGASLQIERAGGGSPDDVYGFADGNGITSVANGGGFSIYNSSGNLIAAIDTVTYPNSAFITFTDIEGDKPTSAEVDTILQQITYSNSSDTPPASVQIDWTFNDGNGGAQGVGGALAATGSTIVDITAVNDAPMIQALHGDAVTILNDGTPVAIDQNVPAMVTDIDGAANFNGGWLTVTGNGFDAADSLGIDTSGSVSLSAGYANGSTVSVGGVAIGTFSSASTGAATLAFNADATAARIDEVMQAFTFETTSATLGGRSVDFQFNDGDGTANGGDDTSQVATVTIAVADASGGLVSTNEDTTYVFTSSDFDFTGITGSNLQSITITGLPTDGTLNYNSLPVTAGQTITKADIDAGLLTFVPDVNENGLLYASFDFYVNSGNMSISVLAGESTSYTLNGGLLPETDAILADSANFGGSGTYPSSISVVPASSTIDAIYLSQGSVLFDGYVPDGNWTAAELAAVDTWVQGGGVLISTNDFATYDDVASYFGLTIGGNASATWHVADDASPVMNGPFGLVGASGSPFNGTGATSYFDSASLAAGDQVLAVDSVTGEPTIVLRQHGGGWILFTGDEGVFRENMTGGGTIATANDRLAANIFAWAADQVPGNSTYTMNVDVTPVNDAPSGTDTNVATLEDTDYVFEVADFGFTDPEGDILDAVIIRSLPAVGDLYLDLDGDGMIDAGDVLSVNDVVDVSDIVAGRLKFKPVADQSGAAYASFTFAVRDDGGTLNGGVNTDQTPNTITIDVGIVNDAPVLGNNALTISEGGTVTLGAGDLSASDADGDALTYSVSGVSGGQFELTTNPGAAITTFTDAQLAAGQVVFVHDGNEAAPTYSVTVSDGSLSDGPHAATVTFTNVNDAPTNTGSLPAVLTVTEDLTTNLWLNDIDLADVDAGGLPLTLKLSTSGSSILNLLSGTGISIVGNNTSSVEITGTLSDLNAYLDDTTRVRYINTVPNQNGVAADSLSVAINDNGNTGSGGGTDIVLGNIQIDITPVNDAPVGAPNITGTPTEDQTLTADTSGISDADGLGTFSYQWLRNGFDIAGETGGTYLVRDADVGQQLSVRVTYTDGGGTVESLTSAQVGPIANVNDAPTGTVDISGTPTEDQTLTASNTLGDDDGMGAVAYQWQRDGVNIAGATGTTYTLGDADVGANITVVATYTDGHGTVENVTSSPVGPVANVNDLPVGQPTIGGTLTEDQTLTADASGISDDDGLGTFNYQWLRDGVAITGATGTTYTLGDADVGTQISVQVTYTDGHGTTENVTSAQTTPVANINDAPVLDNSGAMTLTNVTEDDTNPAGDTVAAIVASGGGDRITDIDGDPEGIAVISADNTNGDWQYSIDGGSNWLSFGSVSSGNAVVLDAAALMRFVPNANFSGAAGDITFRAWDGTNGLSSGDTGVSIGGVGGSTAYSFNTETASIFVSADNDAPTTSPVVLAAIAEDSGARTITQAELLSNASDVEGDALSATGLTISAGAGTLVDNGDGTWDYTPATDDDTSVSFSYTITDGTDNVAGSATLDITALNDAPVANIPASAFGVNEDDGYRSLGAFSVSDVDAGAGELEVTLTVSNGVINLTDTTGLNFTSGANDSNFMTFTGTLAELNNALATVTYRPDTNFAGTDTVTLQVNDQGNTGGPPQSSSDNANIVVAAVNDAPTTSPVVLTAIAEDSGARTITQAELLSNASDVEGDALTATGLTIGAGAGTLVDNGDGTWDYTPAADDDTSVSFSYTITDGADNVAGSASLDITPVNDAPTTSPVVLTAIAEDSGARTITQAELLTNASDVEGDALTVTSLTISAGAGTLVDNGDGTWDYTPAADDDTSISFSYTITDGADNVAGSASLDITPVNDAPTTSPVVLTAIAEDSGARTITQAELLTNASDVEGDALTATSLTISAGAGTLVDNGDGTWDYTPAADDDTSVSFSYTITDGTDNVVGSASLDITPINDEPVESTIEGTNVAYTENDAPTQITNTIAIADLDDTNIESAVIQITGNYTNGQDVLSFTDTGTITGVWNAVTGTMTLTGSDTLANYEAALRSVTYENTSDDPSALTRTVSFTVNDGDVNSNTLTRDIDVLPINDEQVLVSNTGDTVVEGSAGNVITTSMLETTDGDHPASLLVYTVDVTPTYGTLRLNGTALTTGLTFTQSDIDDGLVTYDHDDSENFADSFDFTVDDGGGTSISDTFNWLITGVNDNSALPIVDIDGSGNFVLENAAIGTTVGIVAFSDDVDVGDTISYTLDDNDGGRFSIDAGGVVQVAGAIDRETDGPSRMITVRATSTDGSFQVQNFNITIGDVDEYDVGPVVDIDGSINEVSENAAVGTVVGITAGATDDDATTNAITYSLQDNDGGRFEIDSASGVVTIAGAIDREVDGPTRSITVRATSADGSFTDQAFTININDVDEFDVGPVTDNDAAANTVAENAGIGTTVGLTAFADDADATNDTVTYSLDDNAGGLFAVDSIGGTVTVNGALDYETATSHSVTVRATSADGSFSTQSFTIQVTDVSESGVTPIVDNDGAAEFVLENATVGTNAGITAFADDADGTDTVSYSLDDNAGGRFAIDSTTGIVTVAGAIDREAAGSYDITVRATSTDTSFTTRTFTITIGDVDEFDVGPVTDIDAAVSAVDENSAVGTVVGITADATDNDATTNAITYTLQDNDGGRFAIDSITGIVTVAGAIDRETDGPTRNITVRATSADGSFTDQAFTININDLDEYDVGPVSDVDGTINAVDENAAVGTVVGITANATDADATTNAITWSLQDNDGGRFAIDSATGVVTVDGPIDREAAGPARNITIRATSSDGSYAEQIFSIAINDADEFDVTLISDIDLATEDINENDAGGTAVGITASASDSDATTNAITYLLDDDAGGRFAIDSVTGVVTIADQSLIDYESQTSHDITIRATSADGSTATQVYTINVHDFNEYDPAIADQSFSVPENPADGTSVGTVIGSDADTSQTLAYAITAGNGSGAFAIDPVTGEITVADGSQLDFETTPSYTLTVNVTDDLAPMRTSFATVTINVTDVNEAPAVTLSNVVTNLAEDTDTTTAIRIADINVVDDALGTNLLSLTGADAAYFEIVGSVLQLIAGAGLDFETTTQFDVTVQVNDANVGLSPDDSISHTLNILDANDTAPIIQPGQVLSVQENSPIATVLGTLIATDADSAITLGNWTIVAGNTDGNFGLVASDGTVQVFDNSNLNYELQSNYTLTITVSDGIQTSAPETILVNVTDINEMPVASTDRFLNDQFEGILVAQPGILANDIDEDGDTLAAVLVSGTSHGSLSLLADGSFVYYPTGNFFGTDTFVYSTTDGTLMSAPVTVEIETIPVGTSGGTSGGSDTGNTGSNGGGEDSPTTVEVTSIPSAPNVGSSVNSQPIPVAPAVFRQADSTENANDSQAEKFANEDLLQEDILLPSSNDRRPTIIRSASVSYRGEVQMDDLKLGTTVAIAETPLSIFQYSEDAVSRDGLSFGFEEFAIGSAAITSTSLTVGYVLWLIRGGALLASFASALPAWSSFDPLPIVKKFEDEDDAESLVNIVDSAKKRRDANSSTRNSEQHSQI